MHRCCWPLATVSGAMHDPATVSANPASIVSGTLADHRIQLTTVTGTPIASNDDWPSNTNAAEMTQLGIAPAHPKEAALLLTLDPAPPIPRSSPAWAARRASTWWRCMRCRDVPRIRRATLVGVKVNGID